MYNQWSLTKTIGSRSKASDCFSFIIHQPRRIGKLSYGLPDQRCTAPPCCITVQDITRIAGKPKNSIHCHRRITVGYGSTRRWWETWAVGSWLKNGRKHSWLCKTVYTIAIEKEMIHSDLRLRIQAQPGVFIPVVHPDLKHTLASGLPNL